MASPQSVSKILGHLQHLKMSFIKNSWRVGGLLTRANFTCLFARQTCFIHMGLTGLEPN